MVETLRIMVYRHSVFYSPLIGTIAGGFLRAQGLEATYTPKPAERSIDELFDSGELDIMQAAVSTSWTPLSRGNRNIPVHFAQINQRDGFFIASRSPAKPFRWSQLEGGTLLADHAEQPLAMLKFGLHLAGVDWSRIQAINAGTPQEMVGRFREGVGDFIHLQGPAPQQLETDGIATVVGCLGDVIPPLAFSSLMARREFLRTKKAEIFMTAFRQSLRWVNDAPAAGIAAAMKPFFPDVPVGVLTDTVSRYKVLGCWDHDGRIRPEQYGVAQDVFIHSGVFTERYPFEAVVENFG